MAAVKIPEPVLAEKGVSHWISRNNHDPYDTEELSFRYATEWRGDPVVVDMTARRGRHGWNREDLTWSEWNVYCSRARIVSVDDQFGTPATDLARSRLSEACKPTVEAWLASDAYDESRRDAIYRLVRWEVTDMRPNEYALKGVRSLFAAVLHEMTAEHALRIDEALIAFDAFLDALGE